MANLEQEKQGDSIRGMDYKPQIKYKQQNRITTVAVDPLAQ